MGNRTGRTIAERYVRISDEYMVKSINVMTFDQGKKEILICGPTRINENHEQNTNKGAVPQQSGRVDVSTTT